MSRLISIAVAVSVFFEDIFLKKIKQNKTQKLLIERTFLNVVTQTKNNKKTKSICLL